MKRGPKTAGAEGRDTRRKGAEKSSPARGGAPRSGGWRGEGRSQAPREFDRGAFRDEGDRPSRNTYRRDGAAGGWNRPRAESGRGAPRPNPKIVPARKLQEGIRAANRAIAEIMEEFAAGTAGDYGISELQAPLSFDVDGRFLGFGNGGSATLTLTLSPLDAESVFEDDEAGMRGSAAIDLTALEAAEDDENDEEIDDTDDDAIDAEVDVDDDMDDDNGPGRGKT